MSLEPKTDACEHLDFIAKGENDDTTVILRWYYHEYQRQSLVEQKETMETERDFAEEYTRVIEPWWRTRSRLSDSEKVLQKLPDGYRALGTCLCDSPHLHIENQDFVLVKELVPGQSIHGSATGWKIIKEPSNRKSEEETNTIQVVARNTNVYRLQKGQAKLVFTT